MRHTVIALALGTMLVSTPVLAGNSAEKAEAQKTGAVDKTKYCIKLDDMTGSRLSRQECLTRKQWAAQGVDIDEELKNGRK